MEHRDELLKSFEELKHILDDARKTLEQLKKIDTSPIPCTHQEILDEREECAKIAEAYIIGKIDICNEIARAIRSRK